MGADDADDGRSGACPEHVWVMQGATFTMAGAQVDYECSRCGALMVETGDQLTGRAPS